MGAIFDWGGTGVKEPTAYMVEYILVWQKITQAFSGPTKWMSKWRYHETLKSTVCHGWTTCWPTRKLLNSRRSRMAKIVTFWPWWQLFHSFYFEAPPFFLCFLFVFLLRKKFEGIMTSLPTRCHQPLFWREIKP